MKLGHDPSLAYPFQYIMLWSPKLSKLVAAVESFFKNFLIIYCRYTHIIYNIISLHLNHLFPFFLSYYSCHIENVSNISYFVICQFIKMCHFLFQKINKFNLNFAKTEIMLCQLEDYCVMRCAILYFGAQVLMFRRYLLLRLFQWQKGTLLRSGSQQKASFTIHNSETDRYTPSCHASGETEMTPQERRANVSNMPSSSYINDTQIAIFDSHIVNIENDVWLLSSRLVLNTVVASFCHL